MKHQFAALAGFLSALSFALAESAPVVYRASFENAAHHEARITASFRDLVEGPFVFRMSRSSPGRYALHEFAKNVYDVSAVDGAGRVYTTTDNGVAVLAPEGALLGTLEVDDAPTGLALATDAHLYVTTAGGRLLRVPVRRGVRPADVVAS